MSDAFPPAYLNGVEGFVDDNHRTGRDPFTLVSSFTPNQTLNRTAGVVEILLSCGPNVLISSRNSSADCKRDKPKCTK
jgi:hypothetical protein